MKSVALVDKTSDTLKQPKVHALGDTLGDLKVEALVDTLDDSNAGQPRYTWRQFCQCADQTIGGHDGWHANREARRDTLPGTKQCGG